MPQHHLTAPRGEELAPASVLLEGRFGRMFRNLPPLEVGDVALRALAERMVERRGAAGSIPSGYTYLGQFIDHDITFDPVSSMQRTNDPNALHDFRTPGLDLDSLYGGGPNNDPFMYDPEIDGGRTSFLIGANASGEPDLPRNRLPDAERGLPRGRALIGDPRNDENVLVAQLHLLFLRFHNKVVERVRGDRASKGSDALFAEAQRLVRWHYQWIVVHDFLDRITPRDVLEDLLENDLEGSFYRWQRQPFMPVEFSAGAYRFGHSMIRPAYRVNTGVRREIPIFTHGPLEDEHQDLRGFRPLPGGWTVDWPFFVETGNAPRPQRARRIDSKLSQPLADVPGTTEPHALAERNLRRGRALGLPSGQRVARAMGIEPLGDRRLGLNDVSDEFEEGSPLWFYVLKEAELLGRGSRLGPVGGRIVAEVLLGLIKGDPFSYVNVEPGWKPDLGTQGRFTMADLVAFTLAP